MCSARDALLGIVSIYTRGWVHLEGGDNSRQMQLSLPTTALLRIAVCSARDAQLGFGMVYISACCWVYLSGVENSG